MIGAILNLFRKKPQPTDAEQLQSIAARALTRDRPVIVVLALSGGRIDAAIAIERDLADHNGVAESAVAMCAMAARSFQSRIEGEGESC